ncbi:UvrD-helicase domain-containing protein [Roseateles sp.]|uniref:UvrD-helicase domain-containing protein n=1 Tax=Roseateles sp. TaxID=1971397 RepID=UPI0039E7AD4F
MLEFNATPEQQAIIDADLKSIAVVACPGSGKTATAVRRVAEVRRRLEGTRSHVALLSYSNIAVDTFRDEYRMLRGRDGSSDRVVIQTVDSFITTFVLRPHGSRVMRCDRTPFLVLGGEHFLSNYRFGTDNKNQISLEDLSLSRQGGKTVFFRRHRGGGASQLDDAHVELARKSLVKLAKVGGYTYAAGRAWALRLLQNEPRLTAALARRFPQILVDEAQDIGSFEGEILDLLSAAGSTISLVGDFHQSIYGFNFASGEYLREFSKRADVLSLPLTQNRRSVPSIVSVANALAGTVSQPFRSTVSRPFGAHYWRYDGEQLPQMMSAWSTALGASGYGLDEAAVLCRGAALLAKLASESGDMGKSAVKHFAAAALEREQGADIFEVMEHCAKGVLSVVRGLPSSFIEDLKGSRGDEQSVKMRRLVWRLIRTPTAGIPLATLAAKSAWLPALKKNLNDWLCAVEAQTSYAREPTWDARVKSTALPDTGPLLAVDFGQNSWSGMRCGTVHSAKGEGIPAVLYLTTKKDLDAMVAGTKDEEGRIGFVAVTRARDLLVVGIPKNTAPAVISALVSHGFADWNPGTGSSSVSVPTA